MGEYEYQCQDCEFCKQGHRFVREPKVRKADGQLIVNTTKQYTWACFCVKDIEDIREIREYDDVCEEPGELFGEIDAFPSEYKED